MEPSGDGDSAGVLVVVTRSVVLVVCTDVDVVVVAGTDVDVVVDEVLVDEVVVVGGAGTARSYVASPHPTASTPTSARAMRRVDLIVEPGVDGRRALPPAR
jgi:hypothetical protein